MNDSLNGCQSRAVTEPQREAFSFSKKEKSDGFNRREAPRGVAKGDEKGGEACLRHEQSLRQLAMLVATSLYTKEAFIRQRTTATAFAKPFRAEGAPE